MVPKPGKVSRGDHTTMQCKPLPCGIQTFPRISKSTDGALELLVLVHEERGYILHLHECLRVTRNALNDLPCTFEPFLHRAPIS